MESPARMSLDGAPLESLHTLSSSSNLGAAPLHQASDTNSGVAATLSFRGASAAVTMEEAEALLAYLDRENVSSRAGFTLRKAAGRLLNHDLVRSSLDDADCFAQVGDILASFRAQFTAAPRESPLASPAQKPLSPSDTDVVAPMRLEEEPSAPASDTETPAADVAKANAVAYSALLDRLAGAEPPTTPETEAGSPGAVSPLRRWSERLSQSIKRAGDEILDKLERL